MQWFDWNKELILYKITPEMELLEFKNFAKSLEILGNIGS